MASKIKETLLKEIRDQGNQYEEGSTKRALLLGLYKKIKSYEDDKDIVNTVWANRDLPLRMLTEPELKKMPGLSNLLVGQPYDTKIDYEKTFGKDWYTKFGQIPYNQIAIVAAKQGRDPAVLSKEMAQEATKKLRYDAAHEGVLGTVMPFFAKRTQEAIERGETPSKWDVGLDLGQTALEAVPYGRAAKFIANPAGRFIVGRILSNTTAPLATEAADALAYDTTNARGNFEWADVGSGALANTMGEGFLRLGGLALGKVGAKDAGARLLNAGEGKSAQQARKEVYGNIESDLCVIKDKETIGTKLGDVNTKTTNPEVMDFLRAEALDYYDNADVYATREMILKKLKGMYNDKGKKIKSNAGLSDEDLRFMRNDPVLSKYIGAEVGLTKLPQESQLLLDESFKNLVTNKLTNYQQEQGKAFTRIPFGIGPAIQRAYDESKEEEALRKKYEDIYNQYRFDILGGN